eukprot:scaffold10457_cov176-Skeletonema_menzelii.AAC.2
MSCPSAGTFATTEGSSNWDESTITWSTAPEASDVGNGVMIGTFGAVIKNKWYGFDVTDAIRVAILAKKKDITFRISSGNTESCLYSSKESGREPKLMVMYNRFTAVDEGSLSVSVPPLLGVPTLKGYFLITLGPLQMSLF